MSQLWELNNVATVSELWPEGKFNKSLSSLEEIKLEKSVTCSQELIKVSL